MLLPASEDVACFIPEDLAVILSRQAFEQLFGYTYSTAAEDFLYKNRRIAHGGGSFDVGRAGVWYVQAEYRVPAPPELASKCKHLLYHVALVFEVPPPRETAAQKQ